MIRISADWIVMINIRELKIVLQKDRKVHQGPVSEMSCVWWALKLTKEKAICQINSWYTKNSIDISQQIHHI